MEIKSYFIAGAVLSTLDYFSSSVSSLRCKVNTRKVRVQFVRVAIWDNTLGVFWLGLPLGPGLKLDIVILVENTR